MRARAKIESPKGETDGKGLGVDERDRTRGVLESELGSTFTLAISPLINCDKDASNGCTLTIAKKSPKSLEVLRIRLKVDDIRSFDLRYNILQDCDFGRQKFNNNVYNMIYKEYFL